MTDGEYTIRPQRLPDGNHVLFTLADGDASAYDRIQIVVQSISSGERQVIVREGSDGRYSCDRPYRLRSGHRPSGRSLQRGHPPGRRRARCGGARCLSARRRYPSHRSVRDCLERESRADPERKGSERRLTFVDSSTGAIGRPQAFSAAAYPRASPDGSRIAVIEDGGTWVYAVDASSAPIRVAREDPGMRFGLIQPHIAIETPGSRFGRDRSAPSGECGWQRGHATAGYRWHVPRKFQRWRAADRRFDRDVGRRRRRGGGRRFGMTQSGAEAFLRTARWITFHRHEGTQKVVYVGLVSDPDRQYRVTKGGGHHPLWSRDGRRLYFAANSTGPVTSLMVVDVRTAPAISFSDPRLVVEELLQPLNQDHNMTSLPTSVLLLSCPIAALHTIWRNHGRPQLARRAESRLVPVN